MNLEIRKLGKKKKYYLAHSFREGKKVKKIRRYLGIDLSKKSLEKLRARAEQILKQQINSYKQIKDPLKYELNPKEIKLLETLETKGKIKIGHLAEKDWLKFTEFFTYDTNAIEGSTIKYNEVKDILEKDKWPIDAPKSEISETYGVAGSIKELRQTKIHISVEFIKKLHKIIFKNSKEFAGKYRKKGIEVVIRDGLGNVVHAGAPSNRIKGLLEELVDWYNRNKKKYTPILLAVVVHNQFEVIHPFQDGNGRVGRLLLNNILLKHNLPPVNITLENRREYYAALQKYQNHGDMKPMIELIIKEYKILKRKLNR
ncbi:MAG: Fic family protein [Nanoarchaeota archaeon]|nr:Fic family protein [Nanoarchaeota archaeon]